MTNTKICLTDITKGNVSKYELFEKCYNNNLSQYLSRIYPNNETVIKWCYINVGGKNVGSIWLETIDKDTVKLGVFIAYEKYRHKGFGTLAIKEMIKFAQANGYKNIVLNVRCSNISAYNAYKKIGFFETEKYLKDNNIPVISMKLES
ncbi:MAG: GNAT family N-acetyltransferase [Eubacterium sp.]